MGPYTTESTHITVPETSKGGLFRTADGRNVAVVFVLITSLFLRWGFCNGMIDILNKHFVVAITLGGGKAGLHAMFGTFLFVSTAFPTIFALAIRGLSEHTKLGSSLIVIAIVGGAIAPPFMGHIADRHSMPIGFVVPLVCFVFVSLYGFCWPKLSTLDSLPCAEELE